MFLASIEGNLIGLIIFAAIGVINWLAQKKQEADANRPKPPREATPPARERNLREAGDEEERLRKFMEALGLPPSAPPLPQRPTTTRPPIVARTPEPRPAPRTERQRRTPRGASPRSLPPPLPPARERSLGEADAPALPVEALPLPPLPTRALPEFDPVASHIFAIPHEAAAARLERDAYQDQDPARAPVGNTLAELLRSRDELRRAILLREVLGPPRGLADREALPTFR